MLKNIPSKTFLIGEYTVLLGSKALVLSHSPFFSVEDKKPEEAFHPKSPAGKLLSKSKKEQNFTFLDPHKGSGGFGGSTAEYLAAYQFIKSDTKTDEILKDYFTNFEEVSNKPSGADLCAQSYCEEGVLEYKKEPLEHELHNWPFKDLEVLIFKTKDKVKTHTHLDSVSLENLETLKVIAEEAVALFKEGDEQGFLGLVDAFTKEQAMQGLLHENAMRLIYAINQIKGVSTSRGCGAMGADVLAVFVKPEVKEYVLEKINEENLGLRFVGSSLKGNV
ncbi:MAG: hypothetical protein ACRBBP_01390 [Bdellovibrionales bacterium]